MEEVEVKSEENPITPSNEKNLMLRLASAIVLLPVVLFALYKGGVFFDLAVLGIWGIGLFEWIRLVAPKARWFILLLAEAMLAFVLGMGVLIDQETAWLGLAGVAMIFSELVSLSTGRPLGLWIAGGLAYLGGSGMALLMMRHAPDVGFGLALYLCLAVWGTDTGAYFAGRLIGGPKLAPRLSPKKTWAGLIGGMAFAALLGYAGASGFGWGHPLWASLWAVPLALVAQAGDLLESHLKRRADVKDSGSLIPGHGGILDRIDGLLAAAFLLEAVRILCGNAALGL